MGSSNNPLDVEDGEDIAPAFAYRLDFKVNKSGASPLTESGEVCFSEENLNFRSSSGANLTVSVRDISNIQAADYMVILQLQTGKSMELCNLGYQYEEFVEMLVSVRNKYIKQDLLMHEELLFTAESIHYTYYESSNKIASEGDCNAQLSETALVLAEPDGNHLKFPLSYLSRISDEDYSLRICMETGDLIVLSMLGRQREPLLLKIEEAVKKLEQQSLSLCKQLFPEIRGAALNELAVMFKDGRSVSKQSLDRISPALWQGMEKQLETSGIYESYNYLKQSGNIDQAAIGFKRGLMGELTGEYVWFLIPIMGDNQWMIAMEAGMGEGSGGRATYFYKMPGQGNPQTETAFTDFIRLINYNLLMINFRREPVYLSDEMIGRPSYSQYKYAIERLPSLRLLRRLFMGRAVHSSDEGWKKEVSQITSHS